MIKHSTQPAVGISSIGLAIPKYALPLSELAKLRNTDPTQYLDNLGCKNMALCAPQENVATIAITAAKRALNNWHGKIEDIGLLIVATESALDMSRPLSSWVMQELNLSGQIRSYEVKHACYGGTAAIRQAVEWKLSGNSKGKAALVIAADVAMYAQGHSGEPTQGAGAFATIIDTPIIAHINTLSYYWSESQYDFWRPVANKYPEVNGRLSLTSYINATLECFKQLSDISELSNVLQEFAYVNFHVPFPKMVHKAVKKLGDLCGWNSGQTNEFYTNKVLSRMEWNQNVGNCYTASLWFAVANSLTKASAGENIIAFSYGSGCGAELLTLQCNANQAQSAWVTELEQDFTQRNIIDAQTYLELRKEL